MDTPLISIILPTYNGARYIRDSIDSVLAQDYSNFELIIIDDASTDNTQAILIEYAKQDGRIRVFKNEQNLRLVGTLNRGISLAKGEYIARIDDDDIWNDRKKLTKQLQRFQENPKLGIVGSWGNIIDEEGKRTGSMITHETEAIRVRDGFGLKNQLIHTSLLAKKEAIIKAGGYNEEWLYVEDFDLWLRVLALGYEIENISEALIDYRIRSGNTTAKKYHRMQWLTFLRLFHEKSVYSTIWRKIYCLSIRLLLVILPFRLMQILKR